MGPLRKLLAALLAGLIVLAPGASLWAVAGSWNGVAATAINGVAQTAWNGTGISSAGGGAWTPQTPSNTLLLWTKADTLSQSDNTTITSGTSVVGPNFSTVNGTPKFRTNIKNSLAAWEFDGTSAYMSTPNFSGGTQTQPWTGVYFWANIAGVDGRVFFDGNDTTNRCQIYRISPNIGAYAGGNEVSLGTAYSTTWHKAVVCWNGASSFYKIDGGTKTTFSATPGANSIDGATIACYAGLDTSFCANMYFGEMAEYAGTLSDADIGFWETYITGRWGSTP